MRGNTQTILRLLEIGCFYELKNYLDENNVTEIEHLGVLNVETIVEIMKSTTTLTSICLRHNRIGDSGASAIAETLKVNSTLTSICLGDNQIGDAGASAIAKVLKYNNALTEINLRSNQIKYSGGTSITQALTSNTTVTQIDLSANMIFSGDEQIEGLLKAIAYNDTLTKVNLSDNFLSRPYDVNQAIRSFKFNRTITEIDIGGPIVIASDITAKELMELLMVNNTLTKIDLINDSSNFRGVRYSDNMKGILDSLLSFNNSRYYGQHLKQLFKFFQVIRDKDNITEIMLWCIYGKMMDCLNIKNTALIFYIKAASISQSSDDLFYILGNTLYDLKYLPEAKYCYKKFLENDKKKEHVIIQEKVSLIEIEDFMNNKTVLKSQTKNMQSSLNSELNSILINFQQSKVYLEQLLPNEFLAQYNSTINQLDFGYKLLARVTAFFSKHVFTLQPDSRYFGYITAILEKLAELKEKVTQYNPTKNVEIQSSDTNSNDAWKHHSSEIIRIITEVEKYYTDFIARTIKASKVYTSPVIEDDITYIIIEDGKSGCPAIDVATKLALDPMRDGKVITSYAPCEADESFGKHYVVSHKGLHYKYMPYAPSIEFAVSSLNNILLQDSTPPVKLLKVVGNKKYNKEQEAIYLASKTIDGFNLHYVIHHPKYLKMLNMECFSALIISSLLTCPGDAKPDNFITTFVKNAQGEVTDVRIIGVDNDISFCKGKLGVKTMIGSGNNVFADILNVLYFFPQMDQQLSPKMVMRLTTNNFVPEEIVSTWLFALYKQNIRYINMDGFTDADLIKLKLPIKLVEGTAVEIYRKLVTIVSTIKSGHYVTHSDLFKKFYPGISFFYQQTREKSGGEFSAIKELYVKASDDPNLIRALQSTNQLESRKAWTQISTSKMLKHETFEKTFNSAISQETKSFVKAIDFARFSSSDNAVLFVLQKNLSYLDELILNKINAEQLMLLLFAKDSNKLIFSCLKILTIVAQTVDNNLMQVLDHLHNLEQNIDITLKDCFVDKALLPRAQFITIDNNLANPHEESEISSPKSITSETSSNHSPTSSPSSGKKAKKLVTFGVQSESLDELLTSDILPTASKLLDLIIRNNLSEQVNQQDQDGNTRLHKAVLDNNYELTQLLLDIGSDETIINNQGNTPVDLAKDATYAQIYQLIADYRNEYFVKLLSGSLRSSNIAKLVAMSKTMSVVELTKGIEGDLVGDNSTVLEKVLYNQRLADVTKVIACRIDINKLWGDNGDNSLHILVKNYNDNNSHLLKIVIDNGFMMLNEVNHDKQTPADLAYKLGKYNLLTVFFNEGGKVTRDTRSEFTDNQKLVLKAAKYGIKVDSNDFVNGYDHGKTTSDEQGYTLLQLSCIYNDLNLFKQLAGINKEHANLNGVWWPNTAGQTAYDLAVAQSSRKILEYIWQNKDMPEFKDRAELVSLYNDNNQHKFAQSKRDRKLSEIYKKVTWELEISQVIDGIDINMYNSRGNTVLYELVKLMYREFRGNDDSTFMFNTLIKYGIDVNATNRHDGQTPLHFVISSGQKLLAEKLLKYGSDAFKATAKCKTPLSIALSRKHYGLEQDNTIIKLLTQKMLEVQNRDKLMSLFTDINIDSTTKEHLEKAISKMKLLGKWQETNDTGNAEQHIANADVTLALNEMHMHSAEQEVISDVHETELSGV